MKFKRFLLVISMCILFAVCFNYMSNKYDLFARYNYLTDKNEAIIRKHITDPDDIEFIIQRQIRPEKFMRFIEVEGFIVKNILYYDTCWNERPIDVNQIVTWVNTYRSHLDLTSFDTIIRNYTYESLGFYFDNGSTFVKNSKLVHDPSLESTVIEDDDYVLDYIPNDLVNVSMDIIPSASIITNAEVIQVREVVLKPLQELVTALQNVNQQSAGGLILTSGYISYEDQIEIYKKVIQEHGADQFSLYGDFPGQNEQQLGFTISFTIAGLDMSQIENNPTYQWLLANAHNYGFIQRFPNGKETQTGKLYQPLTFRYVGVEMAKKVYTGKTTFNEVVRKMK